MGLKARDLRISEHGDSTELKKAISLFNPLKLCNGTRGSHPNEALQPMDWEGRSLDTALGAAT